MTLASNNSQSKSVWVATVCHHNLNSTHRQLKHTVIVIVIIFSTFPPLKHGGATSMSVADLAASALLQNCELRTGVPSSGIIPQQCVSYPNVCEEEEDKN